MKRIVVLALVVSAAASLLPADTRAPALSRDYLAADEASGRYRTHEIDPAIALVPDDLSRDVFVDYRTHLPRLTAFFQKDAENDFHTVKRIHDWIADNIAYKFYSKTDIGSVLANRYTNCVGYAELFKLMAGQAGIKAVVVVGRSRTYLFPDGRTGNHAWNVVTIRGRRYLVDTTHDARRRYRGDVLSEKKPYSDDELFTDPAYKFLINYPFDRSQQLMERPRSLKEYLATPRVRLGFVRYGLSFADPAFEKSVVTARTPIPGSNLIGLSDGIKAASPRTLPLANPENLEVRLTLADLETDSPAGEANPDYDRFARVERGEGRAELVFIAPGKGKYRASVQVRFPGGDEWETVYAFIVKGL